MTGSKILIRNKTRSTVLAEAADVAGTSQLRRRGLLDRKTLEPGQGLWIAPCESVHTFGMKFAIDVVYLDRKKKIRKISAGLAPRRISVCLAAESVLEIPSGTAALTRSQVGDELEFVRV
jgi:uncharacterized membrane protein (UPF0127 family)